MANTNSGASDLDVEHKILPLLSCTDIDSRVNIVVVGNHAAIINDAGRRTEVSPVTLDYGSLCKVSTSDDIFRCDYPFKDKTYLIIVRTF